MSSSEIFRLRKQGHSREALTLARQLFAEDEKTDDIWLLRAYAWAIYDHVSAIVERYEAKQLSPGAMMGQLTPYMREFSRMGNALRGDTAFSQILRLAGNVSRDWSEFLAFAKWVGTSSFSDEDKKPFVIEQGKTIDSLQKRFIRAICRETADKATDGQITTDCLTWGKDVLEKALQAEPQDQWLNYYRSKLHLAEGEQDQAIKHLLPIVRRQSKAAWPWDLLGEILEASRPDDALICYAYACQLSRKEQEVAKVRVRLAQRLALAGRFNEAAQQTRQALRYREDNNFRVPPALQQLVVSHWYQEVSTNNTFCPMPSMHTAAMALLRTFGRQNLTFTLGVIDHINRVKELSFVATSDHSGVGLLHKKFPEISQVPVGTVVEIGHDETSEYPLDWRVSDIKEIPNLYKAFSGTLTRQRDKPFAHIHSPLGNIFVTPPMAGKFTTNREYPVSGTAIKRADKQGKIGWRAVSLEAAST